MGEVGDGAPQPEPVARRRIALGDRHEAGQPRLRGQQIVAVRIEDALGGLEADRQQQAVLVQQKAEFHGERQRPGLGCDGLQAGAELGLRCGVQVAAAALEGFARRLDPIGDIAARRIILVDGQGARGVDKRLDVPGEGVPIATFGAVELRQEGLELRVETTSNAAATVAAPRAGRGRLLRQGEGVPDAGQRIAGDRPAPFPANTGQGNEVAAKIAAIH